jgi:transcriptional regulator with XRE-family HTH domain
MDMKKITEELLASGLTQQALADKVPCSQAAINAFSRGKRGQRPTLTIGLRLMQLHSELCGKPDGNLCVSDS